MLIGKYAPLVLIALVAASTPAAAQVPLPTAPAHSGAAARVGGEELIGLFRISRGVCSGGGVTSGSYFRMFDPGGALVTNGSSLCGDKTFTPLSPGSEGGLSTISHQPHPSAAFDTAGNGVNNKITQPEPFYGTRFSTATNPKDPQTNLDASVPRLFDDGGKLNGDLRSFAAAWQGQHFNQGAPKPNGTLPGETKAPSGSFNTDTKAYSLEWKSQIVGGPFNNFTGFWHFEGAFQSASAQQVQQAESTRPPIETRVAGNRLASTGPAFPAGAIPGLVLLAGGMAGIHISRRPMRSRRVR